MHDDERAGQEYILSVQGPNTPPPTPPKEAGDEVIQMPLELQSLAFIQIQKHTQHHNGRNEAING